MYNALGSISTKTKKSNSGRIEQEVTKDIRSIENKYHRGT
jgi:hypothetical protein